MAFASVSQPLEFSHIGSSNKNLLSAFLKPIEEDLTQFESKLLGLLETSSLTSKKIIEYFFSQKGKRVRPAIFLSLCKSFSYEGEHKSTMACVSEYVHAASLLHDDVVDDSPKRRGKRTAHTIWGREASILVGDLIYAQASELMTHTGELEIVASFAKAISQMSEGEIIQLESTYDLNLPEETYFKIISYKTASLLAASCKTAGILAKLKLEQRKALENFGYSLGISFQLVDDALDYTSEQEVLGKEKLKDLEEGKVTLPLILLMKKASSLENSNIKKIFEKEKILELDKKYILDLVKKYKTTEETVGHAKKITDQASSQLDVVFKKNYNLEHLKKLARDLTSRTY